MPHEELDIEDEVAVTLIKGGKKRHILDFYNGLLRKDGKGRSAETHKG